MLKQLGFLGTGAPLGADLALLLELIFYVALTIGILMQIRRSYAWHDRIQTPVVVLNFFVITFIMVASFIEQRVASTLPRRPGDLYYLAVAVHALLGTAAEGLAIYCLLAGYKILPRKIGRLRRWMRLTFALWTATLLFGLSTYYVWYVRTAEAVSVAEVADLAEVNAPVDANAPPPPRRVSLQNFQFAPADLTVVRGTKVIWVNQDAAPHNVIFDDGSEASDNFFQGEAFEHTFRVAGEFAIYCSLHGNATSGMASVVRVVEPTEENLVELAQEPALDTLPPTPTPAPVVPPAPVELIEPPAPNDVIAGLVAFRDALAPSDTAVLALSGIAAAPAGSEYHAWLTNRDNQALDIGRVQPDSGGVISYTYTSPEHRNLMALYDGFQITQEPEFDDDPTAGAVVYSGRQAPEALNQIRAITVSAEETPGNIGYGTGARLQTEEMLRHVEYVQLAFELGSIADARRHAEHVINIIEGERGEFFADHDRAHGLQNPGDGFGALPYALAMEAAAARAMEAPDATNAIRVHADHVMYAVDNVENWTAMVRAAAQEIMTIDQVGEIGPQLETMRRFGQLILAGEDTNNDGTVEPMEGGVFVAYQHAQYMAAIGIVAGDDAAVVDAEPILEPGVAEQVAAGGVLVEMLDYQFSPPTLSIPAGATVRFLNAGQNPHSATADNDAFNTNLLDTGQEYTYTFDEPGTYAYYCLLHGLPGGSGMAGTITVEP